MMMTLLKPPYLFSDWFRLNHVIKFIRNLTSLIKKDTKNDLVENTTSKDKY